MQYLNQLLSEVHSDLARRIEELDLASPASPVRRKGKHDSCADLGSATQACAEINAELALEDDLFWEEEIRKRLLERQDEAIAREILRAEQEAVAAETASRRAKRGKADGQQIADDERYAQELQKFEEDIASGKVPPPPAEGPGDDVDDDDDEPPVHEVGYEGKENEGKESESHAKALMNKMKGGRGKIPAHPHFNAQKKSALAAMMKRCVSWQAKQVNDDGGKKGGDEKTPSAMARLKAAARGNRGMVRKLMTRLREKRLAGQKAKAERKMAKATAEREATEERIRNTPYVAVDGTLVFPKAAVLTVQYRPEVLSSQSNKK